MKNNKNKLFGVSKDEIIFLYRQEGSIRKTAKALGVSHTALRQYCLSRGIDLTHIDRGFTKVINPLYDKSTRTSKSKITKYFLNNPDKPIPRDYRQISKLIGCSYASVQSWFYRRKYLLEEQLYNLPDLRQKDIILIDDIGDTHHMSAIRKYQYLIDPFHLTVILRFWLYPKKMKDGTFIADSVERSIKLDDPKKFMEDILSTH